MFVPIYLSDDAIFDAAVAESAVTSNWSIYSQQTVFSVGVLTPYSTLQSQLNKDHTQYCTHAA